MKVAVHVLYSTAGEMGHSTRTGEDGGSGTGKIGHSTRTKRKHKTARRKRQHGELRFVVTSPAHLYPIFTLNTDFICYHCVALWLQFHIRGLGCVPIPLPHPPP